MALETGSHLGGYQILGLLGAGGMGEVYRAHDPRLNRIVAVKVVADDFAHSPSFRERFRREARVLALLNHPNIATIYAVEEDDRVLALTMEFVEGQNLAELMRAGGMPVERLLKIAIQIADAIAAAHERGITHRDLKPANVIVAADARVKVLDFGLAKLAQPSDSDVETSPPVTELTKDGQIVGTPLYMSPEQAEGRQLDYRSDIFSFGIILYEMCTGEVPFKGQSVLSILTSIVRDTPTHPLELNSSLPREVARIIRRCLAKDPEDRYQSAKDLRNDLSDLRQEFTSGEMPALGRARSRRPFLRKLALVVAASVLAAGGWLAGQHLGGAPTAFLPSHIAQLTFEPGIEMSPSLSPDGKWIAYAKRVSNRSDVYLQAVGGENAINLTKDLEGGGEHPTFSPDGERIAFRGSRQGGLFVMGRTGELARRVSDLGFNPSWSPDGKLLAYSSSPTGDFPSAHPGSGELWIVDVASGEKRRLAVDDAVQPAWSPNGRRIAYWGVDPKSRHRDLWTVAPDGGTPLRLTDDAAHNGSPSWSAASDFLYFSSDAGGTLNLWRIPIDPSTGGADGPAQPVTVPNANAVHPTLSADGKRLAYASYTWTASVFSLALDPATVKPLGTPRWLVGGPYLWSSARVSPDGSQIALVRWSRQNDLFLVGISGSGLRRMTDDPSGVRCPEWSPDGRYLAYTQSIGADSDVLLMNVATGHVTRLATGIQAPLLGCVTWAPDSRRMVITEAPPRLASFILDVNSPGRPTPLRLPTPSEGAFTPRSWSPDGQWLSGTVDSRVAVYSLTARKYDVLTQAGTTSGGARTYWLPNGRHILFLDPVNSALLSVEVSSKSVKNVITVSPQLIRGGSLTNDGRGLILSYGPEEGDIWIASLPSER